MKITNKIKMLAASAAVAMAAMSGSNAMAANFYCPDGTTGTGTDYATACTGHGVTSASKVTDLMGILNTIISVALGLIGFLAVVMIIYGGFQYVMSAGDSGKVKSAKNTILYGIVGLVVALLAYAIINFVINNITK